LSLVIESLITTETPLSMEEPSQTPEQTLKYSFEEILTVEPKHFVDGGNAFKVRSSEANYYGEITVGQRSYIEGASGNLEGTYALFVTENGGSAFVDIEFADDGFSYKNQFLGVKEGDAIEVCRCGHLFGRSGGSECQRR